MKTSLDGGTRPPWDIFVHAFYIRSPGLMDDVLILQAARFGDLVQSKRLVLSLQENARTHIAIDKSLGELGRILYPDAIIHELDLHGGMNPEAVHKNMAAFEKLRAINFTKIYNCNFSPLTAAVCRLFDNELIAGYRPLKNSYGGIAKSGWARLVFALSKNRNMACLNLEDFWGHMAASPVRPENVNPAAKGGGGGIGVALSGREARRSLPVELLAVIIKIVFRLYNGPRVKLLGSKSETLVARKLLRLLPREITQKTADLSGKTNWSQLVEETENLDLMLTPDTGIMHLAAHLGVPVMAFFLSSAWCHETGPYGAGHLIWQSFQSCSPCLENTACPNNTVCRDIFATDAFAKFLTQTILEPDNDLEFPPGLQLWKSGFDALGEKLYLQKGNDGFQATRQAGRMLLASFQGIPLPRMFDIPGEILQMLAAEFCPPPEWMLPRERYC